MDGNHSTVRSMKQRRILTQYVPKHHQWFDDITSDLIISSQHTPTQHNVYTRLTQTSTIAKTHLLKTLTNGSHHILSIETEIPQHQASLSGHVLGLHHASTMLPNMRQSYLSLDPTGSTLHKLSLMKPVGHHFALILAGQKAKRFLQLPPPSPQQSIVLQHITSKSRKTDSTTKMTHTFANAILLKLVSANNTPMQHNYFRRPPQLAQPTVCGTKT